MNAGAVERIVAARNAQEAGALLECPRSQPRHVFERLAGAERTMGVAVQDDILRQTGSDSRDMRANSGTEAVLASTPTALTQSSTTASSERDSLVSLISCWYWPTPMDFGSILTSSASGSCSRRAIDTAPRKETSSSGSSFPA